MEQQSFLPTPSSINIASSSTSTTNSLPEVDNSSSSSPGGWWSRYTSGQTRVGGLKNYFGTFIVYSVHLQSAPFSSAGRSAALMHVLTAIRDLAT